MKTAKYSFILITTLALITLGIGCSTDTITGPQSPDNSTKATAVTNGPDFVLPEGLELVTSFNSTSSGNDGSLDGGTRPPAGPVRPVPIFDAEPMIAEAGGDVSCQVAGCSVPAGALPYDAVVTASVPNPSQAVVDFGPHPLTFNEPVQIWFNLLRLNSTANLTGIQMWYVAEDGTLEEIPITVENNMAIGYTNHFSRYILTNPNN